jgi:protease IV
VSRGWKVVLIVGGALAVLYAVFLGVLLYGGGGGGGRGGWGSSGTVGVLRLDGVVSAGSQDSLFGSGGIDPVWAAETLRDADADSGIDAVVLRVNSPGGSPAASWEIYQAVKAMKKPVVVSVADVAASGAYYFSSPADLIVAAPSSEVGSIGVILSAQDLSGLYDKLGIGYTVLTKGKYKDIGNPARPMTQEEKDILSAQMETIYRQFITDVADGRKNLKREQVEALATGLTYPGEEALRLGLVDKLGSYGDATNEAARLADLDVGDYRVRDLNPSASGGLLPLLFGAGARDALRGVGRDIAAGLREELSGVSVAPPRAE